MGGGVESVWKAGFLPLEIRLNDGHDVANNRRTQSARICCTPTHTHVRWSNTVHNFIPSASELLVSGGTAMDLNVKKTEQFFRRNWLGRSTVFRFQFVRDAQRVFRGVAETTRNVLRVDRALNRRRTRVF